MAKKIKKKAAPKKKAGYPKLSAAEIRQIRSETAFVGKSAKTTGKKKKAAPKKR